MPATKETKQGKPTPKEKKFARKYAETLNGTTSALATYNTKDPKTAGVMAVETLARPRVRAEIERLLSENGIKLSNILSIHERNMVQDEHLPTSQKAVADFYDILGMKTSDKPTSETKIAFIIEK